MRFAGWGPGDTLESQSRQVSLLNLTEGFILTRYIEHEAILNSQLPLEIVEPLTMHLFLLMQHDFPSQIL
jgi:hypothetical protein